MQIMIGSETYPPSINGAAVFTQRLATGLAGRGHEVAVVTPSPTGHPYTEKDGGGVTIFRVRSIPTTYPGQRCGVLAARGARALLRAFRPDLVHIQNHFVIGRALVRVAQAAGIPAVGTNHFMPENMLPHTPGALWFGRRQGILHRELWRQFVRLYRRLDAVTVPSRAAAALAQAQGLRGPVHVISNGIDISRFGPPLGEDASFCGEPRRPTILYVGRLDPEKGVDTLVRAMPTVVSRHPAELMLCGRGGQGAVLRSLGAKLGVCGSIHFAGFVPDDDLPRTYRAATIFVMPSPVELQSLATLEAMASGLPVIAADAMALPELVKDGENGFLCPPGDSEALADRIVALLSDPSWAARMGRASRAIAERHRIDLTLAAFEELYQRLLGKAAVRLADPGTPRRSSNESWHIAGGTSARRQ
jgi:glycosyltransferase involved in cell wall biosynthesis